MKEQMIESLKQVGAKAVTVAATYLIASNAGPVFINYLTAVVGGASVTPLPTEVKLLLLGASYCIWTQAIVPFVDSALKEAQHKPATTSAGTSKKYFEFSV